MMLDHEGRSNLRNGPSQAKKKEEKEGGKSEKAMRNSTCQMTTILSSS